jgi:predicted RNase H-like HicB family nuclease
MMKPGVYSRSPMNTVSVEYHPDPAGWWADSLDLPGWSAAAETVDELRTLVEEGVHFALGSDAVFVNHLLEPSLIARGLVFDFVTGVASVAHSAGSAATEDERVLDVRLAAAG